MRPATWLPLVLLLLLGACATPSVAPPTPPPAGVLPAGFPSAAYLGRDDLRGELYRVDRTASWLRIRVYRAGRLARLGHNHLISSRDLGGYILLADDPGPSRADLYLAVASLVVDDPEERAQAGEDFARMPSESAVAGTRRNLLGERTLDAGHFPFIRVSVTRLTGAPPEVRLTLAVTLRGVTRCLEVPARLEIGDGRLVASGALEVRLSDFAITPFSVMLGAIRVRDRVELRYHLEAARRPAEARDL